MLAQAAAIEGQNAPGLKQQGRPMRVTHMFTLAGGQTYFDRLT
jgi:hypothetical protein